MQTAPTRLVKAENCGIAEARINANHQYIIIAIHQIYLPFLEVISGVWKTFWKNVW